METALTKPAEQRTHQDWILAYYYKVKEKNWGHADYALKRIRKNDPDFKAIH